MPHNIPASDSPGLRHYEGSRILVTGGSGFLGSALIHALSGVECRIVLLHRPGKPADTFSKGKAELTAISGDIQARKTWVEALAGADYVFHFAAQTSAAVADRDPVADLGVNVAPVLHMMETCRELKIQPKILFSGTVTQVGIPPRLPVNESFQDRPIIVYDIHKLAAEKYLQYYAHSHNIPTVTLRLANVYGPGTAVGSNDRGILNLMIRTGLNGGQLTVYGEGARIRDYVYIDDVVRAFLMAGASTKVDGNYYVIGSEKGISIAGAMNSVADRIQLRMGSRPDVVHVEPPGPPSPIEHRDFVADTNRFREVTGWTPLVSLPEGIDRTIQYLVGQKEEAVTQ